MNPYYKGGDGSVYHAMFPVEGAARLSSGGSLMAAETFTYTMKNLDRAKWQLVKSKAAAQGLTVRAVIESLIAAWLEAQ